MKKPGSRKNREVVDPLTKYISVVNEHDSPEKQALVGKESGDRDQSVTNGDTTLVELQSKIAERRAYASRLNTTVREADLLEYIEAELDAVKGLSVLKLNSENRLLDSKALARELGVTPEYVRQHQDNFPFLVVLPSGNHRRTIRYSSHGLERWIERGGQRQ